MVFAIFQNGMDRVQNILQDAKKEKIISTAAKDIMADIWKGLGGYNPSLL